ncbi:hypothetical protein PMI09_00256 [Rhizobium sp. CF122]|nr:hypothetical protein [Rhizobium sp. CF122]EJL58546.1 hypothetical protein PMI09_00256 [Rhizobium sp. CF122]
MGISRGSIVAIDRRIELSRPVNRIEDILDADWDVRKQSLFGTSVYTIGLFEHQRVIECSERLDVRLFHQSPGDEAFSHRPRCQASCSHFGSNTGCILIELMNETCHYRTLD